MGNSVTQDVVVAGAGPVGLMLACELKLAGCSVMVLEKAADPHSPLKRMPFGIRGLSAPTIEALYRRGLLDELEMHKKVKNPHMQSAAQGPQRQRGHFAGIPFLEGDVDIAQWNRLPSATDLSLLSELEEVEAVLTRRAEALGVEIRRGCAITSFAQDEEGVAVEAGGQPFRAGWLVGCDGGRSAVRKMGGFAFDGTEPEFTGYSAQLELADAEKLKPGRTITEAGMYLQSQPGYVVMVEFDGGAAHRAEPVTAEQMQTVLRRISGTDVTVTAVHAVTTWTDRARQATTYRKGRVLLAGDAAHIHAPLGGQGLNLGLGDAMNLGWKLAATVQGRAPEGLLDSYERERQPLGEQVLAWSRAQVALMRPEPAARALQAIVRDLMATRDGATYFAGRVWGVHTRYAPGGEHRLVGASVPNFAFADGTTLGECMRDGKAVLWSAAENASLRALASACGECMTYVVEPVEQSSGLYAALVRPDGIVAWASANDTDADEAGVAAAHWLMKETK